MYTYHIIDLVNKDLSYFELIGKAGGKGQLTTLV
jgi:hypothetical protein